MASFGLFSCTLSLFMPIWKPFIDWMAAWALPGLSKLTKPVGGKGGGVGWGGGGGGRTGVTPLDGGARITWDEWIMKITSVWWSGEIRILQLTATQIQHGWQLTIIMHLSHNIRKQEMDNLCFPELLQRKSTKTKCNIPRKMTPSAFKLVPC